MMTTQQRDATLADPAPDLPAEEKMQAILMQRAQKLAQPIAQAEDDADSMRVLTLEIGGEYYAIDGSAVVEVQPAGTIVAIPGTPGIWLGLVNLRGRLYPVLDLGRLLGELGLHAPSRGGHAGAHLVLTKAAGLTIALSVDSVLSVRQVARAALLPPVTGRPNSEASPVLGLTDDLVALLAVEKLFRQIAPAQAANPV